MKAYAIDDQEHIVKFDRGEGRCPDCGGVMAASSSRCRACSASRQAANQATVWRDENVPAMLKRHRRVKQIMAETGLSALAALNVARAEWRESE